MPGTIDDILLNAAKFHQDGDHQSAVSELDALLAWQKSAPAYHLRSRCFRALGDNQHALEDLNCSLEIEPNNAQGYRERAQLHFLSKRSDLALVDNQLADKYASEADPLDDVECEDDDDRAEKLYRLDEARAENGAVGDREDDLFDRVYEAREEFFEDNFGAMPADVLKLNNMMGVWPGGCLVQIDATELPGNPYVTSTFGLTNPDMPATVRSEDMVQDERNDGEKVLRSTSMRLVARERAAVPPGLAGYGYEAMVLTPEQADWPSLFLSWFVTSEINHDAGWLQRVMKEGALLVKCPLRDFPRLKVVVYRATQPLPDSALLPNGRAHLLIGTSITEGEYAYGAKHGALALLEELLGTPAGQTSVIFRSSCV